MFLITNWIIWTCFTKSEILFSFNISTSFNSQCDLTVHILHYLNSWIKSIITYYPRQNILDIYLQFLKHLKHSTYITIIYGWEIGGKSVPKSLCLNKMNSSDDLYILGISTIHFTFLCLIYPLQLYCFLNCMLFWYKYKIPVILVELQMPFSLLSKY